MDLAQNSVSFKGFVELTLTDENGNVKETKTTNLVVTTGLQHIISRLQANTAGVLSHVAVGIGTTAAAASQTALVSESARVAATISIVTTNVSNDSLQFVATFNPGTATTSGSGITEAGLFNAASAGTMACRTVFGAVNKGALDTLTITWKLVVA